MLRISEDVIGQFQQDQVRRLANSIFAAMPSLGAADVAQRYVREALDSGIEIDRDIAEFTALLFPIDRAGRPAAIDELVRDAQTHGTLKLFQISYALHGEQP